MPETGELGYDWHDAARRLRESMSRPVAQAERPKTAAELALEQARAFDKAQSDARAAQRLRDHTTVRMVNAVAQKAFDMLASLNGLKTKHGGEVSVSLTRADAEDHTLWATLWVTVAPTYSINFKCWRELTGHSDRVGFEACGTSDARYSMMSPEDMVKYVLPKVAQHLLVDQDLPTDDPGVGQRPLDL